MDDISSLPLMAAPAPAPISIPSRELGPFLNGLPDDVILEYIFPLLHERDIARISQTCHYLNYLKKIAMPRRLNILGFVNRGSQQCPLKVVIGALNTYTQLKRLSFQGPLPFDPNETLEKKKDHIQQILKLIAAQPNLEILSIWGWMRLGSDESHTFSTLHTHTSITSLALINTDIGGENSFFDLKTLSSGIPHNLRRLNLSSNKALNDEQLETIVHKLTKLEELDIAWCSNITGCRITSWASQLKSLNVSHTGIQAKNIQTQDVSPLNQLLDSNNKLIKLWVSFCFIKIETHVKWPSGLEVLDISCIYLRHLNFRESSLNIKKLLITLQQQCPRLKRLNLGTLLGFSNKDWLLDIFPQACLQPSPCPMYQIEKDKLNILVNVESVTEHRERE